ncbi:MAG: rhodanese-like domain-containing protein [Ferruginibacter sp.]
MLLKSIFNSILFISISLSALSQEFKYDKVLFKTISPDDLCASLEKSKGYLLLDVRSSGEACDTSQYTGLNIGHLKGAININVRELGNRLSEIRSYKDKPVFVYCSHSQRSRRASKMLVDSGFTNVYNINGGLTSFYYTNAREKGCLQSLIETKEKYKLISPIDLCNKLTIQNKNTLFLLDVRSDSAFRHISSDEQDNAYGQIKNAVNIPYADLERRLSEIPKGKDVVIIDLDGSEASKAASLLTEKGYDKVSYLIEGIDRLLSTDRKELNCINDSYVSPVPYHIMSTKEFGRFASINKDILLLDVRDANSFTNTHKDSYRNVGHLKNAINIPAADIEKRITELESYKDKELLIYSLGGNKEMYEVAKILKEKGFKKINILVNGLFDVRWTIANIKGQEYLKEFVTDVPESNR